MQLYSFNPLSDSRWNEFAASHPRASVFHQTGWLNALAATYAYRPIVMTSTPPEEKLRDGIVFCEIRSVITGNRLVSLPFSDHTEPLLSENGVLKGMTQWMQGEEQKKNWKYIEMRPTSDGLLDDCSMLKSQSFCFHTLDLTFPIEHLFENLHGSCMRRRIRHAEHQQLVYDRGFSDLLLDEFYELLVMTRKRFRLLPQPRAWFRNLVAFMRPNAEIRVIRKDGRAIAAIFTLRHQGSVTYKYGCSDQRFHHLAGMPYLFWKLIEESKAENLEQLDLGRTDWNNYGLIRFKERLGATRRQLNYFRSAKPERRSVQAVSESFVARTLFSALPEALSPVAGALVYRHIG